MKRHSMQYTLDELPLVAQELYRQLGTYSVLTLNGGLGAGKTTLVQEILKLGGIHEAVQSPTFTTVATYTNALGYRFYHFDLYRLESMQDFIRGGFHEYLFEPQSYAFIEWPELILPLLMHHKERVLEVNIEVLHDQARKLTYQQLS